jgi:hypothetical protein
MRKLALISGATTCGVICFAIVASLGILRENAIISVVWCSKSVNIDDTSIKINGLCLSCDCVYFICCQPKFIYRTRIHVTLGSIIVIENVFRGDNTRWRVSQINYRGFEISHFHQRRGSYEYISDSKTTPMNKIVSGSFAEIFYSSFSPYSSIFIDPYRGLCKINIGTQASVLGVISNPTLPGGGEEREDGDNYGAALKPCVASLLGIGMLAWGCWIIILGRKESPWRFLGAIALIIAGYIFQIMYPIFSYVPFFER